jgi:hypothetical protein
VNGTRPIISAGLVLLAVVPLGCSGDDDTAATGPPESATTATNQPAVATTGSAALAGSTAAQRPASTEPATTTESAATTERATTTTPTTAPEGVVPGVPTIELLTGGSGLGARPLLRWEPVDGAATYVLSVNAADGGPLWAWEGSTTEVAYGGGPTDDPDTTGARLLQPATWFVAARDADGALLAASAPVDIAP